MSQSTKLSIDNLLKEVKSFFSTIPDAGHVSRQKYSLVDCLMSGLAIFSLKLPSLLQFEEMKSDEIIAANLKNLYGVENVPSDTRLRERLDEVNPEYIKGAYKKLFSIIQRNKALEAYSCLDKHYILSLDGTGQYSSHTVQCEQCCVKTSRSGAKTYYHNMLVGAIVHPEHKEVFPFAPEPILQQDGEDKNDCEQNASKRFLENFRREHPHLKVVIVQDSLHATGPHIKLLKSLDISFILVSKQNKKAFDYLNKDSISYFETQDEKGTNHQFRYANQTFINSTNMDVKVNLIEYKEIQKDQTVRTWTWVTDLLVNDENVMQIMRAGRARWRIENETFNTLKNQGYNFEHNFGHGYQFLSTVFSQLMTLAFFIDQIQQRCCVQFKESLTVVKRKIRLWDKLRSLFTTIEIVSWDIIFMLIAQKIKYRVVLDTT